VLSLGCGLALILAVAGLGATLENDLCTGALGLREGEPYRLNTVEATSEGDPLPTCVTSFGKGVWFTVQPERDGWMTVSTCDSGFDTVLQVYRGRCDELTAVEGACNDDNGPACTGPWASVRFLAEPEWVYYILVGGYGSAGGDLTIEANLQTGVDLAVEARAEPDPAEACGFLTYTLTLRNLGQVEARGINLQDVLPAGVEFVSAQLAGGSCREENGVVTCSLEALAPAGQVEGQITIRTLATGVLNNLTSTAAEQEDLNPENNLFELVTLVEDTTPPAIQCPESIVARTCDSSVAVSFNVMATDCTPGVRVLLSPPSGSIFPAGQTIVTCEATDEAGNSAQCQFTVQVEQGGVEPAVTLSTGRARQ